MAAMRYYQISSAIPSAAICDTTLISRYNQMFSWSSNPLNVKLELSLLIDKSHRELQDSHHSPLAYIHVMLIMSAYVCRRTFIYMYSHMHSGSMNAVYLM